MPSVVDSLSLISKTMESILDFVAQDEVLSNDFQQYLEKNDIEIETEKEFNNVIIQYMLDMKMQNGLRVLEYYRRNNHSYDDIINALENSVCAIFRIDKILSNAYETTCLCSNTKMTLIPMVKMNHLKQVGKNDFIASRVIELDGSQYILEIYEIISEFDVYSATTNAIRYMLENPKVAHYKNKEKRAELEKSALNFYEKFKELFKSDFVITTNKKIDNLIEFFNNYRLEGQDTNYQEFIEKVDTNRYIKISQLNYEDKNSFLQNAIGGFSTHKEIYDIALWVDKKRGLYVIPFFETFLKSFKEDIEGKADCIREFLTNDKIPPSLIKYASEKEDNFFEVINTILKTEFTNLEELLFNTKAVYVDEGVFSPISVLYNSELFSTILNFKEPEEKENELKRNELCPCGSGLKYKKCCGKN